MKTTAFPHAAIGCVIVVSLLTAGCDDGRPQRVPVSGIVTIDGKPLTSGSVRFTPEEGRVAKSSIDSQGRFALSTFEPGDGCPLGTHAVAVRSFDAIDDYTVRWNIPKRYLSGGDAGLTATIDGPTDSLHIELTWDGSGASRPFIERTTQ